jgi:hypothetical protein
MRQHTKDGYIIAITMIIIALAVGMVTYVYKRVSVYMPVAYTVAQKEKASLLTLSGLEIARGRLAAKGATKKEGHEAPPEKTQKPSEQDAVKQFYMMLLPTLNRWQRFVLTEERDGVDATIAIAIGSEHGKINLNQIYDFQKHVFRKSGTTDWALILAEIFTTIEKQMNGKEMFAALKKFLDQRSVPLNDITELLEIKEFSGFKDVLFYEPPRTTANPEAQEQRPLFLTDIFTVYTPDHMIDPWLLSDSLCALCGFVRARTGDEQDRVKIIESVLKNFKSTYTWKTDWKPFLMPIYQKELQSLPKGIESVLQTTTNPTIFSIYVTATYGRVTQRLYALVERSKKGEGNSLKYTIEVRKIYRV